MLGEELWVGAGRYTVVGVLPEGFTGVDLEAGDLWLPLGAMATQVLDHSWHRSSGPFQLSVFGRPGPAQTSQQTEAQATTVYRGFKGRGTGRPPSVELGPVRAPPGARSECP